MPTIELPIRYRSPYGLPNALTPPDDVLPGFDPNFAQAQNLDTASNASPAPADIPPVPRNGNAAMDTTDVKLPSLKPSGGIRKFKTPTMPPPEQIGSTDQQVATNTGPSPVTPAPSASATPPAAPTGIEKANQNLDTVHAQRPAAPGSNWAQRLGLAILSMTKLAPVANQIIHPKWAQQQSAYEGTLADAQEQQKEAVEAERGEAYSAQKEAQAESYQLNKQARDAATQQRTDAAKQKVQDALIRAGYVQLNPNDPVPQGWATAKDPSDPAAVWARRSPIVQLPDNPDVLKKFPGSKAGDQVAAPEYDGALKAIWAEQLEGKKAGDKAPKEPTNIPEMQLAYQHETDPVKKQQLKSAIDAETAREQKLHPQTTINLSPEAIEGIGQQYGQTGQLPSLGFGKDAAAMRANILNNYFKGHAGADVAQAAAIFHADKNSLGALQKNRDAVVTFENTAGKNLDLFTKQAQPIIDSGSPWINQPLRSVSRNGLGSADLAAYDAARRVAMTEVAKVVSNPGLSGQLSDSARKEVDSLNPESATLAQIYRVVGVLKQDMANRHTSYDQMLGEIKGRMGPQNSAQPTHRYNPQTKKIEAIQ